MKPKNFNVMVIRPVANGVIVDPQVGDEVSTTLNSDCYVFNSFDDLFDHIAKIEDNPGGPR